MVLALPNANTNYLQLYGQASAALVVERRDPCYGAALPEIHAKRGQEGIAVERLDAELADEIQRAVDARRDDTVRLLKDLVRVPSVTGQEGAVQEVVEHAFRARGLAVDRWEATPEGVSPYTDHVGEQDTYSGRPNVVGVRAGLAKGGSSILLNAHVDMVASGARPGRACKRYGVVDSYQDGSLPPGGLVRRGRVIPGASRFAPLLP